MNWINERIGQLRLLIAEATTTTGKLYYRGRLDEMQMLKNRMVRGKAC